MGDISFLMINYITRSDDIIKDDYTLYWPFYEENLEMVSIIFSWKHPTKIKEYDKSYQQL